MRSSTLPYANRAAGLVGSVIDSSTSLLHKQTHDIVRFAMGSPAAEAVPSEILAGIAADQLSRPDAYDYAATEGDPPLHAALLQMLHGTSDETTADRLTITAGGMQGLDLFCKIFVDPGDLVAVESPTYTNGSATALSYGATLLEVPVDDNGMDVDALERLVTAAGRRPKAIYTIPTFQNPSGVTLSLDRRLRLLELARDWGSMVLDDDPYGLLRFAGDPLPTLRELGGGDPLVFSVRTFSKIVAPGLRVGWVDTVPELQPLLINAKQAMDTCTNLPAQRLLAGFLTGGHLAEHLVTQRAEYRRRKEAMLEALREHFGGIARWTDPEGGFFLWVTLDDDVHATPLFDIALAEGVAFIPGAAFSPTGRFANALRLCFASTPPDRIREGVARLRRAVDALRKA
ncbi:aminotransferase-like domain-containing protein [Mycolicibacterium goodii]|uniref:aminotransferase-like domain-containing protein n=1 Tax=Mycolicibacterium goodii TaxID=134601 RepID=UPI000C26AE2C|nr:PLP-dependent aminotransferase family protein [Mycolicibacterium goodii]MBU8809805.1 PLP-dependent aminotransferase family protein [Mycolicibacterium goodii]MBU8819429.1 PLP-dependent aminotransferase family protein [Mycolicibacterium goodii]MBU8829557.1 PLP-dependent aminotransferase family protein [Mycolicibacterium goodii]PJK21583.1 aspartate aminotransferase [Mycolicibacterium goodii]ULN49981.1 PLP-dependent aminotransferase family protein [Mycolicibacterium goodii]